MESHPCASRLRGIAMHCCKRHGNVAILFTPCQVIFKGGGVIAYERWTGGGKRYRDIRVPSEVSVPQRTFL